MSPDPSPWSDLDGPAPEPDFVPERPRVELIEQDRAESAAEQSQEATDLRLWRGFAGRLTRDGGLIS